MGLQPYSYILYDVAGNYTEVKSFYLIKDATPPSLDVTGGGDSLATRMVLVEPSGAHTHRNPAASADTERSYVIKQAASDSDKYKVTVKLNGIEAGDKLISGSTAAANTEKYHEFVPTATQSGLAAWAVTSDGAAAPATTSSAWKTNFDSNKNIEFHLNDYISAGKKITLHLKDNCGNVTTTGIDIKEVEGNQKVVLWTVDGSAPVIKDYYPTSRRTGSYEGTDDSGEIIGRTYRKSGYNYFNCKAFLKVTYDKESCLYGTASAEAVTDTASAGDYTVRARILHADIASATGTNIIGASGSNVSPWYYFRDTDSMDERSFCVPYPNLGEGNIGYMYLLLEDAVGNQNVTQINNGDLWNKFRYANEPLAIRIKDGANPTSSQSENVSSDFPDDNSTNGKWGNVVRYTHLDQSTADGLKNLVSVDNTKTIYVDGTTTIVNPAASFNIELVQPVTSNDVNSVIRSYKYDTEAKNTARSDYNVTSVLGTTINATLLDEKGESGAEAKPLYLYICDNVGNLSITKLGETNWLKDSNAPTIDSWVADTDHTNPNNSYIKQEDASGTMSITIAASTQVFKDAKRDSQPYTVYIPTAWFSDNGGSGVYGIGFDKDNASTASTEIETSNGAECFALKVPASKYNTAGTYSYYVYDKVYNYSEYSLSLNADDRAPTVGVKFSVAAADARLHSDDLYTSYAGTTLAKNPLGATTGYAGTNSEAYTLETHEVQAEKTLWTNTAATGAVMLEVRATDTNGISLITVNGTAYSAPVSVPLTATTTKTLYEIAVTDRAGNTMTHKVNLQLDNTAPTIPASSVGANRGARIKGTGADATLYYNDLILYATISDNANGVGLGGWSAWEGYEFIETNGNFEEGYEGVDNTPETILSTAHDKLGNSTTNSVWEFNGVQVSKFYFDKTVPSWNDSPISVKRNGFMYNSTWTEDTSDFVSYASGKVLIKSNLDANIIITPSATDEQSGIVGYIASTSNTKPIADSTTDYPTQFLLACGEGKTTGFVDTIKKTIPTGTQTAAATNANFNLQLAAGQTLPVYFFPVDYAGNVGAAQQVTFAYEENRPVVDGAITVEAASGHRIHQAGGVNYFRGVEPIAGSPNAAEGEDNTGAQVTAKITLNNATTFPLTGFKLVTYRGTELAHHTYNSANTKTSSGNYTFNLPYSFDASTSEDVYIVFYNNAGDSAKHKLEYGTTTKLATWANDKSAPAAPTAVTQVKSASDTGALNDGSNGFYLNGTKLYYSGSATTAYLNFTVSDNSTNPSDIKGVGTSSALVLDDFDDNITNPYKIDSTVIAAATDGKQKFYAYDNVLNRETTGYEITYIEDTAAPKITGVTVAGQSGSGFHRSGDIFYFNANSENPKKVTSITFTVNANDKKDISGTPTELSGIRSYEFKVDSGEAQKISSNTFTLDSFSYTNPTSVAITVIDNVGNRSETKTITLTPDDTAPTISVDAFKNGSSDIILDSSENIHFETASAAWRTVSGGTVYFNGNTGKIDSPSVTFTADTSTEVSGVDGTVSVKYNDGAASGILTADNATTTVTATVSDNVGNESTFTVTFMADNSAPTFTHTGFYKNDAKASLEATYISPAIAAGTATYYYNSNGSRKALPVFTASDGGANLKGVYIRDSSDTALSKNGSDYYYAATSYGVERTFVAVDNVGNEKTIVFTTIQDAAAPVIRGVEPTTTPTPATGSYLKQDDADTKKYYFNAGKTGSDYNVTSITLAVTADDKVGGTVLSDIASYSYKWGAEPAVERASNVYTITDLDYENEKTIAITATDKVGNTCAAYNVTFVPIKPPTITVATLTSGGTDYADNATYISAPSNWKTVSGSGIVYFNADEIATPAITFANTAATGIGIVSSNVSYLVNGASDSAISAEDGKTTTVTASATDNVGNTSTFTVTFIADKAAPTLTLNSFYKDAIGTALETTYLSPTIAEAANTYYYNSNDSRRAVPVFSAEDGGVGLLSVTYDGTALSASGGKYSPALADVTDNTEHTFKATDKVGHETEYKITLIPDATAPTISVETFKNGSDDIFDSSEDIHFETASAAWRTVSGGTVYFNGNTGKINSPKITFEADASTEVSGVDGTVSVKYNDGAASGISTADNATTTVTATVSDNVGNESTFTVTFKADNSAPTFTHTGFYKNDAKASLEATYISPAIAAGVATYYYNSNESRKALPVFTASDGGANLKGVYIRDSSDTALSKNGSDYYYAATSYGAERTFVAVDNVGNEKTIAFTTIQDAAAPVIAGPELSDRVGMYLDAANKKLYYKGNNSSRAGTLSFTAITDVGDAGLLKEDGFMYSASVPASIASTELETTYSLTGTELTGAQNFYTADKVGNISDAYTLEFVNDTAAPYVYVAIGAKDASDADLTSGYHDDGENFYFGSSVKKITFTVTADDKVKVGGTATELSGVASYSYKVGDTPRSETTSTLTIDAPIEETTVVITVTDNVGNPTVKTINLVPDTAGPKITISSFNDDATPVAIADVYIAGTPTAWANVAADSIVFFDGDEISSPNVAFSATDASGVDGTVSLAYSSGSSIAVADGSETTVTATAKDGVGNTSTFAITFKSDTAAPSTPSINKITGTIGEPPAALGDGEYYPDDYANWKESAPCFFKGASGTIEFESSDGGSGLKGIYKDDSGTLMPLTSGKELIVNAANTTVNVVALDNLGHQSAALTFTATPDGDAPTDITPTLGGTWYELKNASGVTQMYLYDAGHATSPATISVAATETSGVASYALQYGAASSTPAATDWTTTLALPESITNAQNSYFWLWLKDNVGNATSAATQIAKEGKPIAKYAAPTGLTYTLDTTTNPSNPKFTISGYPLYAGLKAIRISDAGITNSTTGGVQVGTDYVNNTPNYDATDGLTLTLKSGETEITYMPAADIVVTLYSAVSDPVVYVIDASGKSTEVANAVAGASLLNIARAAVVDAVETVTGGARRIGTNIVSSVKSLFGIASTPNMPASETASASEASASVSASVAAPIVETSAIEQTAHASASETASVVTVPNLKKETTVRTLTYSSEEELSPTASASETNSASASVSETTASVLLLTAFILAIIVTFFAVWVLKKKKNML